MASTEHLQAHHSLRSQQKRDAVLHTARAMVRSGLQIEWVALAARAGVSEKFIHDRKHADIKAQVREMIAAQAEHQAQRQVAEDDATIASLRVELMNLRAQLKRKDAQLSVLERKLSIEAGQQLEADLPRPAGSLFEQQSAPRSARSSSGASGAGRADARAPAPRRRGVCAV